MKKYIQPQLDCIAFAANDIVTMSGGVSGQSLLAKWSDFEISE